MNKIKPLLTKTSLNTSNIISRSKNKIVNTTQKIAHNAKSQMVGASLALATLVPLASSCTVSEKEPIRTCTCAQKEVVADTNSMKNVCTNSSAKVNNINNPTQVDKAEENQKTEDSGPSTLTILGIAAAVVGLLMFNNWAEGEEPWDFM